jgi:ABC-2 type transport system ATP-binding protein
MTIFFSSHILSEVQIFCKRVAVIKEGRIIRIENIETLRSKQLKKVQIVFADSSYERDFAIKGISDIMDEQGNAISFIYSGEINDLTTLLAKRNILNLTIEEPSLEEIFMHYYK